MGRGYSVQDYREVVARLRSARVDLALSTDLIVGFPGETAQDFEQTLSLVEEMRFASLFAFLYSPRPGTAAPRLPDRVEPQLASQRLQIVLEKQESIQRELNEALVGSRLPVLITGSGSTTLSGRTACHRIVHFEQESLAPERAMGEIHPVLIEKANPHSLIGRAV
jgi:tRNA-2-methylthio-N6-dimethylallyladenosine synthase